MEGSVSGRIVLGFGCRKAGNRAGRELGPGLWGLGIALRERAFSLPLLVLFFSPSFLVLTFQGTGNSWILSVLQLF